MLTWLPYPLLRASGAFALGVFAGFKTNPPLQKLELLWVVLFGVYFWLTLKTTTINFRTLNPWLSALGLSAVFLAGSLRTQFELHKRDQLIGSAEFYEAKVLEPSEHHTKYQRSVLAVQWVWLKGRVYPVNDCIQWYQSPLDYARSDAKIYNTTLPSDGPIQQKFKKLSFGDRIVIKGAPRAIGKPDNPREFDYASYMSRRNIFWQHWVTDSDIIKISSYRGVNIDQLKHGLRAHLKQAINDFLLPGAPQEITNAMLLGDRRGVSDHLEVSFARSGTLHILAVSGLHLGILYWLLLQFLGSWRHHFILKWLFILISLLTLWSFTLITGMAASTQRAAIMFSILLLGNTLSKESNGVNTLGGSALIILWVEPYQLHAVGFQLSYTALAGILYLHPLIVRWWPVKNRILKYFWELISVSLAAQVTVLPLSVYYFHQFPVYFLLANIFLIPLAFAIVVVGIVFFISTLLPSLVFLVAGLLSLLTKTAGFIVQIIGDLPGSTVYDLEINTGELAIFYGLIWAFVVFCQTRRRQPWLIFLGLLAVLVVVGVYRKIEISHRRMIVVYQVAGHTAMDFIDQNSFQTVMDRELVADTSNIEYKIKNFRRYLKLNRHSEPAVPSKSTSTFDLWSFKGKRVLLIKAPTGKWIDENIKLKSHIVIVSNNSVKSIDQIKRWLMTDLLLIDGSNDSWIARNLEEQAIKEGINVHNCWTKGAKIINL